MILKEGKQDLLQYYVFDSRENAGIKAGNDIADAILAMLEEKEELNIIFAAAPSQNETLAALLDRKEIPWNRINAFHMDEYIGLPEGAPQGFGQFLKDRLFGKAPFKSVNYLNGNAEDPEKECERYSQLLKENPTDIVCLGIGENGHIAFNDPHVAFFDDPKMVKIVELDNVCRQQQVNDGCFNHIDEVPTHALTLTVPTLKNVDCHICIVPAPTKAQAVKNTVYGEITEKCPASIMRLSKDVNIYLDADSSSLL